MCLMVENSDWVFLGVSVAWAAMKGHEILDFACLLGREGNDMNGVFAWSFSRLS